MVAVQECQLLVVGAGDGEVDVGLRERAERVEPVGSRGQGAELPFDAETGAKALRGESEAPVVGDCRLKVVEGGRPVGQQVQAFGNRIGSTPSEKVVPMAMYP